MDWAASALDELIRGAGSYVEPVLRLLLAAALGGIIGLEREASGKPAGFRTNLLICLGAALITELSVLIAADATLPGGFRSDPGRIAAQIVSGIGFLGAGTILQSRGSVVGLTTAATLWVVAAIGMAVGSGAYVLATAATALVVISLMMLGRVDAQLVPWKSADRTVRLTLDPEARLIAVIEQHLRMEGVRVSRVEIDRGDDEYTAAFGVAGPREGMDRVVARLVDQEGIRRVTLS